MLWRSRSNQGRYSLTPGGKLSVRAMPHPGPAIPEPRSLLKRDRFRLIVQGVGSQDPGDPGQHAPLRNQPTIAELRHGSGQAHILRPSRFSSQGAAVQNEAQSQPNPCCAKVVKKTTNKSFVGIKLSGPRAWSRFACATTSDPGLVSSWRTWTKACRRATLSGPPETAARQPSSRMCLRAEGLAAGNGRPRADRFALARRLGSSGAPDPSQLIQLPADVGGTHQTLADQDCTHSGALQAHDVIVGANPAFADQAAIAGQHVLAISSVCSRARGIECRRRGC